MPSHISMSVESVQVAHDALLGLMPEGASHSCELCQPGAGAGQKEVAEVADGGRTFTETEHFALLTDAVSRETAGLQTVNEELTSQVSTLTAEKAALEDDKSTLANQLDVLEAEKVAALAAAETAVANFEAYKTGLEEKAAVEERKATRVAAVKEAAAELLDDSYFVEARVQRWAEMSDESFEQVIADFRDLAAKQPAKGNEPAAVTKPSQSAAVETAAFSGGTSPTDGEGSGSVLSRYLTATGAMPAAAN